MENDAEMYVNIESERLHHGLTRADVALYVGVERDVYISWVFGELPIPVNKLRMLVELFQCSADVLLSTKKVAEQWRGYRAVRMFE